MWLLRQKPPFGAHREPARFLRAPEERSLLEVNASTMPI